MIPLALVTGFLGSGKTTLLGRIAQQHRGERLVFLVNEFSELDIDGERLAELGEPVVTVPGGSIFCRCLTAEFIRELCGVLDRFDAPGAPLGGVVVEASGMADPRVVDRLLTESRLDTLYSLETVVCVIDPGSFHKLVHTLPAVSAQVSVADRIVLNKVDLYSEEVLEATEAAVRAIRPDAPILRAVRGEAALDLFAGRPAGEAAGEYALCRDPSYDTATVELSADVDLERLRAAVEAAGDDVYRMKGYVPARAAMWYVDVSGSGWTALPSGRQGDGRLAIILRGGAAAGWRLVDELRAGAFAA